MPVSLLFIHYNLLQSTGIVVHVSFNANILSKHFTTISKNRSTSSTNINYDYKHIHISQIPCVFVFFLLAHFFLIHQPFKYHVPNLAHKTHVVKESKGPRCVAFHSQIPNNALGYAYPISASRHESPNDDEEFPK